MKYFGIGLLALVWIAIAVYILSVSELTLRTILTVAFSGIIIFVPLWKRYIRPVTGNKQQPRK